jgi:hypothetical protein
LFLNNNQLTGAIPEELGELGNLEALLLRNNQLNGDIPAALGDLGELTSLDLGFNQLSGSIPPELGNLSRLSGLSVWSNQLSGPIPPELGNLGNLVELNLEMNQLNGSIPPELGNLANVVNLTLFQNQLTGPIPGELGNLSSVKYLDLSYNQLTGSVPAELGSLGTLYAFYLNSNQLSGLLPLEVAQLGGSIQSTYPPSWCGFVPPGNEDLYMPDTEAYRLADVADLGAICSLGFTASTEIVSEDLTEEIEDLVADEVLNSGQGNSLLKKLENAQAKAERGQYQPAINIARAFISHISDLVAEGLLTAEEAQPLIDRAMVLIELWTDLM